MGWVRDDAQGHEGYIVGLEEMEGNSHWYELSYFMRHDVRRRVHRFKVGCDCGWRSRVFYAPSLAEWFPYSVELHSAETEDAARELWEKHVDDERSRDAFPGVHLHTVRS